MEKKKKEDLSNLEDIEKIKETIIITCITQLIEDFTNLQKKYNDLEKRCKLLEKKVNDIDNIFSSYNI